MIGNVALDVVIGLVFIYLLYSLYATIIMEIISSIFGLRARNLCYALSRMLMDEKNFGNKRSRFWARLGTTVMRFTGKSWNLKNPELYEKFFNQPSIKYLSSGGIGHRPSYFSAENFSKTLIDAIKVDSVEVGELLKIQLGLRAWPISEDEHSTPLPEISPIVKRIKFLLDQPNPDLVKFKILLEKWYDSLPVDTDFEVLRPSEYSDTINQIDSMLRDANNDLVKFKILLENWYNDTMERATGWFKQTTQVILIIIGSVLAISFNVDTIAIINKLSQDKEARERLVKMSIDFTEKNADLIEAVSTNSKDTSMAKELNQKIKTLAAQKASIENDILKAQDIVASPSSSWSTPLGYLLTVLAISLGAPFWFDLLNKLVSLRTSSAISSKSGTQAKSADSDANNRNILNRAG